MNDRKIAAVTGATGVVGPTLIGTLQRSGYAVRALVRGKHQKSLFDDSVPAIVGDICDATAVAHLTERADVVFHLAAKLHISDPAPALRDEFWRVNVEGTRALVEAAQAGGIRRLIFFSTTSIYGATRHPVDEEIPPNPDTWYAETKLAGEQIALAARARESGEPLAVVLRMAAIYGPRMKGNYSRLVRALSRGRFVPVGNGSNRRTLVYEKDAVRAAMVSAEFPFAGGKIYNVSDGQVHTLREIILAICHALRKPAPRVHVPLGLARVLATAADRATSMVGRSTHWQSAVDKFTEDSAVNATRFQRELGFQPRFDLHAGWKETIRELRRRGEI